MVNYYFLDSSAMVKRYIPEIGTSWIRALAHPEAGNLLAISRITWVEVLSAFSRRQREGTLSPPNFAQNLQLFRYDVENQYQLIEVSKDLTEMSGQLVTQYPLLRAYDAVQLASAITWHNSISHTESNSLTFLTADNRLLNIAQSAGVPADNPNNHP